MHVVRTRKASLTYAGTSNLPTTVALKFTASTVLQLTLVITTTTCVWVGYPLDGARSLFCTHGEIIIISVVARRARGRYTGTFILSRRRLRWGLLWWSLFRWGLFCFRCWLVRS